MWIIKDFQPNFKYYNITPPFCQSLTGREPVVKLRYTAHEPFASSCVWLRHEPERSEWFVVGLLGIEPSLSAPKADVLPVYYSPKNTA